MHCDLYGRPRENPSPDNGVWYALAAAAVVFVGAGLLTARSAQAAPAPNPNTPVTPPPPRTVRPPPAPAPTYVRQADGFDPSSSAATRVMQQQLKDLGYRIPRITGIFDADTTLAVTTFLDRNEMSFERTTARDFFQAIDAQYAFFFDTRGGLRTV